MRKGQRKDIPIFQRHRVKTESALMGWIGQPHADHA